MGAAVADSFLYFAYGSNLLKERIHVQVKGAEFITTGRLPGHALFFAGISLRWRGAAASIKKEDGDEVWGCVWRVPNSFADELDAQEHHYDRRTVSVETANGAVECRTYEMREGRDEELPPSPHYKEVIVRGAEEHSLPSEYLHRLRAIPHNGYGGTVDVPISFLHGWKPQ